MDSVGTGGSVGKSQSSHSYDVSKGNKTSKKKGRHSVSSAEVNKNSIMSRGFKKLKDRFQKTEIADRNVKQLKVDVGSKTFGDKTKQAINTRNQTIDQANLAAVHAKNAVSEAGKVGVKVNTASIAVNTLDSMYKSCENQGFDNDLLMQITVLKEKLNDTKVKQKELHKSAVGEANQSMDNVKVFNKKVVADSKDVNTVFDSETKESIDTLVNNCIQTAIDKSASLDETIKNKKTTTRNNKHENLQNIKKQNEKIGKLCGDKAKLDVQVKEIKRKKKNAEKAAAFFEKHTVGLTGKDDKSSSSKAVNDLLAQYSSDDESPSMNESASMSDNRNQVDQGIGSAKAGLTNITTQTATLKTKVKAAKQTAKNQIEQAKQALKEAKEKGTELKKERSSLNKEIAKDRGNFIKELKNADKQLTKDIGKLAKKAEENGNYLGTKIAGFKAEKLELKSKPNADIKGVIISNKKKA